jgi:septal ring factor EnvC (AmiA/AmiB activator)
MKKRQKAYHASLPWQKNLSLFLCLVLFLGPLSRAFAQSSDSELPGGNSQDALSRLIGISTRLAGLNERLRTELEDSRKSSLELRDTLERSKTELDGLRTELEDLRRTSQELSARAETSSQELEGLRTALTRAESSLTNLEQSFAAYRMTAEARIAYLERSGRFMKYGLAAAVLLALGGWTAFALGR